MITDEQWEKICEASVEVCADYEVLCVIDAINEHCPEDRDRGTPGTIAAKLIWELADYRKKHRCNPK